ncbi:MAG: transcription termination factor Rho [Acidimicrobiales bacterium]
MTSDRSTLEGKDRAELTVIAKAMGNKVGSRMRKGQIIDLIVGTNEDDVPGGSGAQLVFDDAQDTTADSSGGNESSVGDASADDSVDVVTGTDAGEQTPTPNRGESQRSAGKARQNVRNDAINDRGNRGDANNDRGNRGDDRGNRGNRGDAKSDRGDAFDDRGNRGNRGDAKSDRGDAIDDRGNRGNRGDANNDRGDANNERGNRGDANNDRNDANNDRSDANNDHGNQSDADQGNKRRRRRRGRDREELAWEGEPVSVDGFLDLRSDGYGFLRVEGGLASRDDCYVPVKMVRDFGLRSGDRILGTSRPAARNEKNPALLTVEAVNERDPDEARGRPHFDDLTPIFPNEQLVLERASTPANLTARIVDLVAPIGKGQRGLIVAPPKAGKTTVIKEIVRSIEANHPEVRLIVMLIDERPEEVTDMKRWLDKGEVVASTFDRPTEEHIAVAELVSERARRMVESGDDVCIIMDGITRLARAYNLSGRFSGRTMSGGVDAGALYPGKRLFGSARNIEGGGSLTILATALVETGSRMDEVIFEEFKGTGNMELRLSRDAAEKRMWPAVDIAASSTRHDELLMDSKSVGATTKMRRVLDAVGNEGSSKTVASLDLLLDRLTNFKTNADFLNEVAKSK